MVLSGFALQRITVAMYIQFITKKERSHTKLFYKQNPKFLPFKTVILVYLSLQKKHFLPVK